MNNIGTALALSYDPALISKLVSRLQEFGYKPEELEALLTSDILGRIKYEIRILPKFELVKIVSLERVSAFSIDSFQQVCRLESAFVKMFGEVREPQSGPVRIACYKSVAYSPSFTAGISLLGGPERAIMSLGEVQALVASQKPTEQGVLCTQNWNVFYVHGVPDANTIQQVVVGKDPKFNRWMADVHPQLDDRLWMGNTRFFGLC